MAWLFTSKFDAYFQSTFTSEHLWVATSEKLLCRLVHGKQVSFNLFLTLRFQSTGFLRSLSICLLFFGIERLCQLISNFFVHIFTEAAIRVVLLKKMFLKIWQTSLENKHLCWSLFSKSQLACNFLKKRLQHRWFPVKFAKFLQRVIDFETTSCVLYWVKWVIKVVSGMT